MLSTHPDPFQKLRDFPREGYIIIVLSIISGLATGSMIGVLVNTVNQPVDHLYWFSVLEFSILMVCALSTKWIAMSRTEVMIGCQISEIHTAIGERLRVAELADMERQDHATYLYSMIDTIQIRRAVVKAFNGLQALVSILFTLVYILWLSPIAGFMLLLILLLTTLVYRLLSRRLGRFMRDAAREEKQLLGYIDEFMDGFQEVKSNPNLSESLVRGTMLPVLRRIRSLRSQIGYDEVTLTNLVMQGFFTLLGICVFLLRFSMTEQTLATLVAVILFLWKPIWSVIDAVPAAITGYTAWQRLLQLGDKLPPPTPQRRRTDRDPWRPSLPLTFKTLQFDQIGFDYHDRDGAILYRLGPVAITLFENETLFIVGSNGSGKSTLVKLMTGLYRPSTGQFLLNGQPVAMYDHQHLFSVIFNDVHLFERPYGIPDLETKSERVQQWLNRLGLANKVQWCGNRFSNIDLAPGERKRLALIGALLEDKPILIFDEWVAEQDPTYRRFFYETLLPDLNAAGKTVMVISHDDAYFACADRIITMQNGQITTLKRL